MNGWPGKIGIGLIGAILGAGGFWLTRHDAGVAAHAQLQRDVADLLAFKARVERNIEEWRRDQGETEARLRTIERRLNLNGRGRHQGDATDNGGR